jgi:hypothetical protein
MDEKFQSQPDDASETRHTASSKRVASQFPRCLINKDTEAENEKGG